MRRGARGLRLRAALGDPPGGDASIARSSVGLGGREPLGPDSDRESARGDRHEGSTGSGVWGRDHAGNVTGPRELVAAGRAFRPSETPWAYLLGLAAVAALVVALVRARLHALARRERDLSAKVDARTRQLREANDLLIELSYVDALTAIANRRRFDEVLELEWRRAVRSRSPLALAMIDIDSFKAYNDGYGHQQGDACLRAVAAALADGLVRAGDMVGRYGGEEFGVILPGTGLVAPRGSPSRCACGSSGWGSRIAAPPSGRW